MKHLFPGPEPKERRAIAVEEAKKKVKGKWNYLWVAVDIDNWEVLWVWITEGRNYLEALVFLRKALKVCNSSKELKDCIIYGGVKLTGSVLRIST